jgi:oligopeptide transport system substrate-binding protein
LYRNLTYGFSLSFPADWTSEETGKRAPIVKIRGREEYPLIEVYLGYLPEPMAASEYAKKVTEELKGLLTDFTILWEGEIPPAKGYAVEVSWTAPEKLQIKAKLLFVMRGTQVFEVIAKSPTPRFDQQKEIIDKIIVSFSLEEPQPFGIPRKEALTLYDIGPITLDPALSREMRSHIYILQIFSGLVTFDHKLNLIPDIAEKWEISEDGRIYTFFLRRGVKFHDGREVKAQDFKYSWERAARPETKSQTVGTYLGDIVGVKEMLEGKATEIRGVKVIDDYTLQVTIDAPKAYFLPKLTYPVAFVVDRNNVERGGEWWQYPNGTGPFKLKVWVPDELFILERNPHYYLEPPKTKYILFRLWGGIPMRMYETGEIDVTPVYLDDLEKVRDPTNPLHKELKIIPELSLYYLGFNTTVPPFDDVLVRRAFSMAVDKDKLVRVILKEGVEKAEGILPPGLPGYNPFLKTLPYDPVKARELLAASQYKDKLPIIYLTTAGEGGPTPGYLAFIIQQWKENLGVKVTVRQLDPKTYFYRLKEEKDNIFDTGWIADYPDPHNFLDVLFYSQSEHNFGEYSNPQVDKLLEKARVEKDAETRLKIYQKIEQILVDEAAILPLWFGKSYILVKPYVKGYNISPMGVPSFKEVSLEGLK